MPPIEIVKATPEDFDRAFAIHLEYLDAIGVVVRDDARSFRQYFEDGGGFWMACATAADGAGAGPPVGCIALRPLSALHPGACEVKRLYVRPAFRSQGVAGRLLDALEAYARGCGAREIFLDTKDDLHAAIAFYTRRGYVRCARYNDNPQATIFMSLRLAPPSDIVGEREEFPSPLRNLPS